MTIKLTEKRLAILNLLKAERSALSASEIHAFLPEQDLVTIYRNLELFVTEGLLKKVQLGGNEARFEYQAEPHHHAVCTDCDKIIHFTVKDATLKKALGLKDFVITDLEVVAKGSCLKHQ